MLRLTCILIPLVVFSSCSPDKETIVNEIIIRDTVYVNDSDSGDTELGGLRLQFVSLNEFGVYLDENLPGLDVRVPGVQNVNISSPDDEGQVLIDGLISGRTYGIEISLKNRPYALLEAREIGSNIHLDFPHHLLIFDISNTEIQSVNVEVHMPTAQPDGLKVISRHKGISIDSAETKRGIVIFLSRDPNPDPLNHDIAIGRSFEKNESDNFYEGEFLISPAVLNAYLDVALEDSLYYSAHGASGTYSSGITIVGYSTFNQSLGFLSAFPNVNEKGISGSLIYR